MSSSKVVCAAGSSAQGTARHEGQRKGKGSAKAVRTQGRCGASEGVWALAPSAEASFYANSGLRARYREQEAPVGGIWLSGIRP
eukprot:scaffold33265_cov58-Phaeocystis_antarctica.AAC.5